MDTAKLGQEKASPVKVEAVRPFLDFDLSKIFFSDEKNGWLVGWSDFRLGRRIFKTVDGGRTFQPVTIDLARNADLVDIFFIDPRNGWILLQVGECQWVLNEECRSELRATSVGGKTWQSQIALEKISLDKVRYVDARNGWLIGNDFSGGSNRLLVLRTSDGGKTWLDTTTNLNAADGYSNSRAHITGLEVTDPGRITISTFSNKLFETADDGKTWKRFGPALDLPPQTALDNLRRIPGTLQHYAWRGTNSEEGPYSYLATEDKSGAWTLRWFDNSFCLSDLLYLSGSDLIAAGSLFQDEKRKDSNVFNTTQKGMIYLSRDGGRSWLIVYEAAKNVSINALARVSKNRIMAVGSNGPLLNIDIENLAN